MFDILSDKELDKLFDTSGPSGSSVASSDRCVAEAQKKHTLKQVVKWLEEHLIDEDPRVYHGRQMITWEEWQELQKEIEK